MRLSSVVRCGIVLSLAGCASRPAPDLREDLASWIESGELVGAELLILREGEIYLHEAFGWKDRESATPMEINSVYSLASLTKPVTALAVLIAAEEGALSLDDPVVRHIPSFRGDSRARVRDLLAQRSGDGGEHGEGGYNVYAFPTLEDWVLDWAPTEASAPYGAFEYSNFNYAALGYIVERVTHVPFGEFVTRRILEPLGMTESYVAFSPDSSWAGRVPTSYVWNPESGRYEVFWRPDKPQRWAFFPAAFGLWGTAHDYAKFVAMWFELGRSGESRLVSEKMVRTALSPQSFRDGEAVYGYGWFVDPLRTEDDLPLSFRHSGGDGTLAIGFPSQKGVVIYLTQSEVPPPHLNALRNRIEMSGLFDYPGTDLVWLADTDLRESPLSSTRRAEYVGNYTGSVPWLDEGEWEVVVWEEDGILKVRRGKAESLVQDHLHLVPLEVDQFTYGRYAGGVAVAVDPPARLRFLRRGGIVVGLETALDGRAEYALDRVDAPSTERLLRAGPSASAERPSSIMLRMKDGKFAEHWNVGQAVPTESANDNTLL